MDSSGTAPAASDRDIAKLRIAYLINQYPKVSHTFIRREILEAERRGVEVQRFALRGWDADVADEQDRLERTRTTYTLKDGLLPLLGAVMRTAMTQPRQLLAALKATLAMSRGSERPLPYHLVYLAHACRIREWLKARPVTHLHAHFGTNTAQIARLVRLLGGPAYSFTVHGPDEIDDAKRLHLDEKVADAKFVVAISSYTRSQLMRYVRPVDWHKIKIVHCGLDEGFHDGADTQTAGDKLFVCVGRLSPQKGHLILLEAFHVLLRSVPGCSLVLAGDGELRPLIEQKMRELGLEGSVRITGWLDSAGVRQEILKCRALVQPSLQEGLPVVIMEAMALGRPVITTYIAGIPELVRPGENGWLVPAGNVDDLARAMEDCMAAPDEQLRRMGEAGRGRTLERHSIKTEVEKLMKLFG